MSHPVVPITKRRMGSAEPSRRRYSAVLQTVHSEAHRFSYLALGTRGTLEPREPVKRIAPHHPPGRTEPSSEMCEKAATVHRRGGGGPTSVMGSHTWGPRWRSRRHSTLAPRHRPRSPCLAMSLTAAMRLLWSLRPLPCTTSHRSSEGQPKPRVTPRGGNNFITQRYCLRGEEHAEAPVAPHPPCAASVTCALISFHQPSVRLDEETTKGRYFENLLLQALRA